MPATVISGYLCGAERRHNFQIMSGVSVLLLFVFNAVMWYVTSQSTSTDYFAVQIASIICSIFSLFFLFSGFKTFRLLTIRYYCTGQMLSIIDGKQKYTIDLGKGFFITTIRIRFYHGKSSEDVAFYLISPAPICNDFKNLESLNAVRNLLKNNALILPVEDATTQWLSSVRILNRVADYPNIMYYPSRNTGCTNIN